MAIKSNHQMILNKGQLSNKNLYFIVTNLQPLNTVEPLNKGHFGSSHLFLYIEVVLCLEGPIFHSKAGQVAVPTMR